MKWDTPNTPPKRVSVLKSTVLKAPANSVILQKGPQGFTLSPQKGSEKQMLLKAIPLTPLTSKNVTLHLNPPNGKFKLKSNIATTSADSSRGILKTTPILVSSGQVVQNPQMISSVVRPVITSYGSLRSPPPLTPTTTVVRPKIFLTTTQVSPTPNTTSQNTGYKIVMFNVDHRSAPVSISSSHIKSNKAYMTMLNPEKLLNVYKCMAFDCTFTTNSGVLLEQHFNVCDKKSQNEHLTCPYCIIAFNNTQELMTHYEQKHIYCNFQCCYCFYRAVCKVYVEVHQVQDSLISSCLFGFFS